MPSLTRALREAPPRPFPSQWVTESLLATDDRRFARAYRDGLDALPVSDRRGALSALTGAVAEAVAARVVDAAGLALVAQLTAQGTHGVDLVLLTPAGRLVAVEVKGSLRGRVPRLRRGRRSQMSAEWLDVANAAMEEWQLLSADIFGAVLFVDLAETRTRLAVTADYEAWCASDVEGLDDALAAFEHDLTIAP
jgi:hypothetical protein